MQEVVISLHLCLLTERISKCESQPCQNEGTCVEDEEDGFHCTCSSKYQGKHCEGISNNVVWSLVYSKYNTLHYLTNIQTPAFFGINFVISFGKNLTWLEKSSGIRQTSIRRRVIFPYKLGTGKPYEGGVKNVAFLSFFLTGLYHFSRYIILVYYDMI